MKEEKKKKNPSLMKDLKIKRKKDKVLSSGPRPARTHPLTRSVKKMPLFWRRRLLFARSAEKKETHEIVDRRGHKKRASIVFEQVNI